MGLSNGEVDATSHELLQAQAHVWNHIFQFINSMALKCAVQLGIPHVIHNHGQPITLSNLVAGLNVHPSKSHFIARLMRILVHTDIFALTKKYNNYDPHNEQKEAVQVVVYSLTPASTFLLQEGTSSFVLMLLDPIMTDPLQSMGRWFQMDGGDDDHRLQPATPFEMTHGRSFWDLAADQPKFGKLFNEAMQADSQLLGKLVTQECGEVFEGLDSLVDVGGGTGSMARTIANAFPNINCIVFDQPHVVADLEGTQNLDFIGGDMFVEIPPANAVFLKWILHDWNDEDGVKILKKCREAIVRNNGAGGKVIILDMAVAVGVEDDEDEKRKKDKKSIETQLMFDMLMMADLNGKERTEAEWEKLFLAAGFSHHKIAHTFGIRSLIEVYP